jgi:DNA-binding transcriptional regulator YhcF (GntR family)
MKAIDLNEFTSNFMEISKNLTLSEMRMLYLLITKPDVIKISQQAFANEIGAHRRTINIGYKNLFKNGYINIQDIPNQQKVNIDTNITNEQIDDNNFISTDIKNTLNIGSIADNKIEKENTDKITNNENSGNSNLHANGSKDLGTSRILYDKFLHDILVNKQYARIPQFLEEFPNKHTEILIDIRNDLPDYIDFWALKYGFEEELEIIRISNSQIKELKKNILHKEKFFNELSRDYIKFFQQERKRKAIQVIRQALIYYPFMFEKFLYDIRACKYDDFDEIVQAMIKEIYKTDRLYIQDGISTNP